MTACLMIERASPNSTIQDAGRPNARELGLSDSGPMDRGGFYQTLEMFDHQAGETALEFTMLGIDFVYTGPPVELAAAGGNFMAKINGADQPWPLHTHLQDGDKVAIKTGPDGMYGYVRFGLEFDVKEILGSKSTNLAAHVGGVDGRCLRKGDCLNLEKPGENSPANVKNKHTQKAPELGNEGELILRVLPGLHADLLGADVWNSLFEHPFCLSSSIDRMGLRLQDDHNRFANLKELKLVSDTVVPGDVQILGDGTAVILMRDHQPTGGYPRLATLIDQDLDRVAQLRPNHLVKFQPISLQKAHQLYD